MQYVDTVFILVIWLHYSCFGLIYKSLLEIGILHVKTSLFSLVCGIHLTLIKNLFFEV